MDRRDFVKTLGILGLAGGGAAHAADAQIPATTGSEEAQPPRVGPDANQGLVAGDGPAAAIPAASGDGKPNVKLAVLQLDTIACEVNLNVHKLMIWTRKAFENQANYVFLHEGATADYTPNPLRYGRPLGKRRGPRLHDAVQAIQRLCCAGLE